MSLYDIFNVSGSAMSAQSMRLNTTASNLANADTVASSEKEAYRSRQAVFKALVDDQSNDQSAVGVKMAAVVESQNPVRKEYSPGNPLADKDGFIYRSNVNEVEEMVNMISASRSYQNNVEVANTAKQLLLRTLRLGE
jgi:flagellar basal-body rod protein FlgC